MQIRQMENDERAGVSRGRGQLEDETKNRLGDGSSDGVIQIHRAADGSLACREVTWAEKIVNGVSLGYGVPLIDWNRGGRGVLVSSGSGIMLAVMDAVPTLRWAIDIDSIRGDSQLVPWLTCVAHVAPVAVVGWFSITSPTLLSLAMIGAGGSLPFYAPSISLPGIAFQSLADFISHLKSENF